LVVESLLITAAELHVRADLEVVDTAETTLAAELPAAGAQAPNVTSTADAEAG
jgi:hypothetical protein